jgi:hypothetical protein
MKKQEIVIQYSAHHLVSGVSLAYILYLFDWLAFVGAHKGDGCFQRPMRVVMCCNQREKCTILHCSLEWLDSLHAVIAHLGVVGAACTAEHTAAFLGLVVEMVSLAFDLWGTLGELWGRY